MLAIFVVLFVGSSLAAQTPAPATGTLIVNRPESPIRSSSAGHIRAERGVRKRIAIRQARQFQAVCRVLTHLSRLALRARHLRGRVGRAAHGEWVLGIHVHDR